MSQIKIDKRLTTQMVKAMEQAYHRTFKAKYGPDYEVRVMSKVWQWLDENPRELFDLLKAILVKSVPTEHKGDPLSSVSNSLFLQTVVQKAKELQEPKEPVANRRFETDDKAEPNKL